jgi:hypothetical protein
MKFRRVLAVVFVALLLGACRVAPEAPVADAPVLGEKADSVTKPAAQTVPNEALPGCSDGVEVYKIPVAETVPVYELSEAEAQRQFDSLASTLEIRTSPDDFYLDFSRDIDAVDYWEAYVDWEESRNSDGAPCDTRDRTFLLQADSPLMRLKIGEPEAGSDCQYLRGTLKARAPVRSEILSFLKEEPLHQEKQAGTLTAAIQEWKEGAVRLTLRNPDKLRHEVRLYGPKGNRIDVLGFDAAPPDTVIARGTVARVDVIVASAVCAMTAPIEFDRILHPEKWNSTRRYRPPEIVDMPKDNVREAAALNLLISDGAPFLTLTLPSCTMTQLVSMDLGKFRYVDEVTGPAPLERMWPHRSGPVEASLRDITYYPIICQRWLIAPWEEKQAGTADLSHELLELWGEPEDASEEERNLAEIGRSISKAIAYREWLETARNMALHGHIEGSVRVRYPRSCTKYLLSIPDLKCDALQVEVAPDRVTLLSKVSTIRWSGNPMDGIYLVDADGYVVDYRARNLERVPGGVSMSWWGVQDVAGIVIYHVDEWENFSLPFSFSLMKPDDEP